MNGKNINCEPSPPKDTRFKSGETETVHAGRNGGIRSGEVRRFKAERRNETTEYLADVIYTQWLTDVTEEELDAFIRWRGQQKRKCVLAKKRLEHIRSGEDPELAEEYARIKRFADWTNPTSFIRCYHKGITECFALTIAEARERSGNNKMKRGSYIYTIVSDMVRIAFS